MLLVIKGVLSKCQLGTLSISALLKNRSSSHFPKYLHPYIRFCNDSAHTKYFPSERKFLHGVLENLPEYNMMVFNPAGNLFQKENKNAVESHLRHENLLDLQMQDLCDLFETSIHLNKSRDELYDIFNVLKLKCHEMDDDQLASVLKNCIYSSIFKEEGSPKLNSLWKEFDKICFSRWKTWNLNTIFYFIDLWYCLNLIKQSQFVYESINFFIQRPKRLSTQQTVQLLFYLNVWRRTKNSMFDLELRLKECVHELSIGEIGVAFAGFFKTENRFKCETIIVHAIDKTIEEIKDIPEITLSCILKGLRYSMKVPLWPRIPALLDAIEPELPRLTMQCSAHACLLAAIAPISHSLIGKVTQKLLDNINGCRLKEMEKIIFVISQLDYNPDTRPCIYQSILNELNKADRQVEIVEYPKPFIALVYYLCLKEIYPIQMVQKILDMDYITATYGKSKFMLGREVLCIDTSMELECPSYIGPRLPVDIRNYLSKVRGKE